MTDEVFFLRCWICGHEISVGWGPETHSTARRLLTEHINGHSREELLEAAIRYHGLHGTLS